VSQAERLRLADVDAVDALGNGLAHDFEEFLLAAGLQLGFELVGFVEVVLDGALGAAGDEDELGDAGGHRFFHGVLDEGLVDDGQHFLGARLGGGEEPGAIPATGNTALRTAFFISFDSCG